MVELLERPAVRGSQTPRIRVVPDGVDHPKLGEIAKIVERLWPSFDEWQWDVLRTGLLRTKDSARWAAFTVAVCAPRQNGKNLILEAREVIGATVLGEPLILHTAHLADTSKEGFYRLDQLIEDDAWLEEQVRHIWRANGFERIEFRNGSKIRFRTRTRGGSGRGFAASPLILDEPMYLAETKMNSIMPVMSAQPDPQIWYTGSAVDQVEQEDGIVFARVRDRALNGDTDRLAYWEWSLPFETPDQVIEEVALDPMSWSATNPALGVRISPDYVQAEARELDPRGFAVERLGVGDWPAVDGSAAEVISLERWDGLADDPKSDGARMLDPVVLAVDTTPDRSMSTIAACGLRSDGLAQVEIVDRRPGTGWVPDRLKELDERHSPAMILMDASGPAGSVLHQLDGLNVEAVSAPDHAKACGLMYDTVDERALRHLGGLELRAAVKGATKRPLGDAWAWSRRNSAIDISPLVAATLALWGYSNSAGLGDWTFH